MLRKDFLRTLSDWVSEALAADHDAMDAAADAFGLRDLLDRGDYEQLLGLFSEWLVFDRAHALFGGKTGVAYFVERNPLGLPESDIAAYRDLLSFEVGLFEVRKIERGRGVLLYSFATGDDHFVHDVNTSLEIAPGNTMWTRIAPVQGVYHCVGSSVLSLPVTMQAGMRDAIKKWGRNAYDAREAARQCVRIERPSGDNADTIGTAPEAPLSYEDAKERFIEALVRCGMANMFSIKTCEKWVLDEAKYDLSFAPRALYFLTPEDAPLEASRALFPAGAAFANTIPRKSLEGRTPQEAYEADPEQERHFDMDIITPDAYMERLGKAHALMRDGKFEESYGVFEDVMRRLLEERTPFFSSFRVYANAAVCCFHVERDGLGEEMLAASLRINPLYDFAMRTSERYVQPLDDMSNVKRGYKRTAKSMRRIIKEAGVREYRRTVFRKYEKFLADIGVSLRYETHTEPTVFVPGKNGNGRALGRNDPCWCGSGKKFKKCHLDG